MSKRKISNVVIVGGGGHAKVLKSIIDRSEIYEFCGYTDIFENKNLTKYLGTDDVLLSDHNTKYFSLVIGISYVNNVFDNIRQKLIGKFTGDKRFNFPSIISENSFIDNDVIIKEGTTIINGAIINTGTIINEFCIVNTNSSVDHDCILGKNTQISPGSTILGGTILGDNVFVGAGSTILDGLKIADNVVIGAGSLVRKDIDKPGVYAGNPLKKIN